MPIPEKILEITTSKHCPVSCRKYCPQKLFQKQYGSETPLLKLPDFKKALEHTPKDVRIVFSGFSEPFTNPQAVTMLEHAHQQGYQVCVYSTLFGVKHEDLKPLTKIEYAEFVVHLPDNDGITPIDITQDYLDILLTVKQQIGNSSFICMTEKTHPKIRYHFPEKYEFVDNMRAGNVEGTNPPYVSNPECVKLVVPQFVMLPNCDVVLCCMDFGLKHRIGNLLIDDYGSIKQRMKKSYTLCHTCLWARMNIKNLYYRQTMRNIKALIGKKVSSIIDRVFPEFKEYPPEKDRSTDLNKPVVQEVFQE